VSVAGPERRAALPVPHTTVLSLTGATPPCAYALGWALAIKDQAILWRLAHVGHRVERVVDSPHQVPSLTIPSPQVSREWKHRTEFKLARNGIAFSVFAVHRHSGLPWMTK
jgi:hypothetical protein